MDWLKDSLYQNMININQRKSVCKFLRRLSKSSVVCLCCRKVNTNLETKDYEEKNKAYIEGFGYVSPSKTQTIVVDSDGDINKMVAKME